MYSHRGLRKCAGESFPREHYTPLSPFVLRSLATPGSIPPELGNLSNVEVLGLNDNCLTGKQRDVDPSVRAPGPSN